MNYRKSLIVLAIAAAFGMAGCKQETVTTTAAPEAAPSTPAQSAPAPAADMLASVNGEVISLEDFREYISQKMAMNPGEPGDPAIALNEMINKELLRQAAIKAGIDKKPDVVQQIELNRNNILINALVNEKVDLVDTSDTALKAEYDEQVKNIDLKEYNARHILVNSEDEAKEILAAIQGGQDFAKLAEEKSIDPSAKGNGGSLGWFQPRAMVKEFGDAVKAMSKGDISSAPVKTQFGWHVIRLDDIRDLEAPSFEESKDRLKSIMANKAVQNYLTELRNQATIDIRNPEQNPVMPNDATHSAPMAPATDSKPQE